MSSESQRQQARFWRKFLRLTRGRLNTLRALSIILQEPLEQDLRNAVEQVLEDLKAGTCVSDAFRKHPRTFSLCVTELLTSAENSGAWDEILEEIAGGLEEGTFD